MTDSKADTAETMQGLVDGLRDKGHRPAILEFRKDDMVEWSWPELADAVIGLARGLAAGALFDATVAVTTAARRHLGLKLGRRLLGPLHRRIGPRLRLAACGGSPLAPDLAYTLADEGEGDDRRQRIVEALHKRMEQLLEESSPGA
ncbi:MAG: hypothetical protein U5S82_00200 [Gammaproteobacteria bacterium]|nr:hypothetical protein [Gammaproteobacteria bacterium]